jgi:hypothetical protein|tara:strand:- start:6950 stop:7141 length:192 start_codon:yes stop_codon:yes gene_type:complete
MSDKMSQELEGWLDDWSAKLDTFEASAEKEVFNFNLFEKFASFVMKISSIPQKHFFIALDEEE